MLGDDEEEFVANVIVGYLPNNSISNTGNTANSTRMEMELQAFETIYANTYNSLNNKNNSNNITAGNTNDNINITTCDPFFRYITSVSAITGDAMTNLTIGSGGSRAFDGIDVANANVPIQSVRHRDLQQTDDDEDQNEDVLVDPVPLPPPQQPLRPDIIDRNNSSRIDDYRYIYLVIFGTCRACSRVNLFDDTSSASTTSTPNDDTNSSRLLSLTQQEQNDDTKNIANKESGCFNHQNQCPQNNATELVGVSEIDFQIAFNENIQQASDDGAITFIGDIVSVIQVTERECSSRNPTSSNISNNNSTTMEEGQEGSSTSSVVSEVYYMVMEYPISTNILDKLSRQDLEINFRNIYNSMGQELVCDPLFRSIVNVQFTPSARGKLKRRM